MLRAEPRTDPARIAAVGYGTGGGIGLELGRDGVDLRVIGTVEALTTGRPGKAARIRCPVWAGVGSQDPIMPPAQRDAFTAEMQAAGIDWRLVVYGGALHAFHYPQWIIPSSRASATTHGTRSEPGAMSSTCSPNACPWRSDLVGPSSGSR